MKNNSKLFFLMALFALTCSAQNEKLSIVSGQQTKISFKVASSINSTKCNVEVIIQGQGSQEKEALPPEYEIQVEVNPQAVGIIEMQWKGKTKFRGINSTQACAGDGIVKVSVTQNNEQIISKWSQYFKQITLERSECIKIGLDISQIKYQSTDTSVKLSDPEEQSSKNVFRKCDAFLATNKIWGSKNLLNYDCVLDNNIRTMCEGVYSERLADGSLRYITKAMAIQLQFENKSWTTAQRETVEAKVARLKVAEDSALKLAVETAALEAKKASENIASKENNEKERKLKESPEYKKIQAELDRQQAVRDKIDMESSKKLQFEAERQRIAEEKVANANAKKLAIETEKQRVIDDKNSFEKGNREKEEADKQRRVEERMQLEKGKRDRVESMLLRPLINPQDPRVQCLLNLDFDSQFAGLEKKISLTGLTDLSFSMLSDSALAAAKEVQTIALWADGYKKCINDSADFRKTNYGRELNDLLEREDAAFLDASIELYGKKIAYGKYNSRIQKIAKESKINLDSLVEKMKLQKAAIEATEKARVEGIRAAQQMQDRQRAEQENAASMRAAAIRDAQQRQNQQQQAEERRQQQIRQAEQARLYAIQQQWAARCAFDKRNAYEQYIKSKEGSCNTRQQGLAALCAIGTVAAAEDYSKSAFASCMSGAPN